jgi:hemoglobin-like flavoprotein
MTPEQIRVVKQCFAQLVPDEDSALETFFGEIFYSRLFDLAPQLRLVFTNDISRQSQKLLEVLHHVVQHLEQPNTQQLAELGSKHRLEYKVQDNHYTLVGEALIWTLEATLQEDFDPELRDAWLAAYCLMAHAMTKGKQK